MTKFIKDPSTHPANGPLSVERLIRVRDELATTAKRSDGGNLGYMMADAAKAIDEVLAVRAAPQFPQSAADYGRDQFEEWFKFHHGDEHSIVKLHRANGGANYRDQYVDLAWIAWKDSRTAMLQDAHRDLSYPVDPQVAAYEKIMEQALPDGWVAVPVEPTEDMVIAGFEAELREEFRDPEAWEAFEAMSGCEQAAHRAKLCWAAMIAAAARKETN